MGITAGQAFPSNYMGKEDFVNGPIRCIISRVAIEPVKSDDESESNKVLVYFAGDRYKPLICNRTNWTTLEEAFGPDSDTWIGKTLEVYHDTSIMFKGQRKGGTRIRIPAGVPAPAPVANGAVVWTWAQAQAEAAKVGLTKDQIVAALKTGGATNFVPARDTAKVQDMIRGATPPTGDEFATEGEVPPTDSIPF